ncbi:hypothetical protein GE300_02920 [Rhodobacteraceae bacterium 2CG4]|uniref:Antibiotic biosynthesis monooxygenase n=1 Tax=Halovulum marinum TaxID=2662447 RepID=A0A6L5YXA0_9RHOB|nr:hypothetical protein [Halovulum marinum]MSU88570.1 hypothetical protein [Halovulum marinum]
MYARITRYQIKSGHIDAAKAQAEAMKADIMALPGIKRFVNAIRDDGSGYIVTLVSSQAEAEASLPRVREIWGKMAEHLDGMPTPEGFDVVAQWENT